MDDGSLNIGLGEVSAQRTSEERLPGVENSSKMKKCDQCGREVQEDLLAGCRIHRQGNPSRSHLSSTISQ